MEHSNNESYFIPAHALSILTTLKTYYSNLKTRLREGFQHNNINTLYKDLLDKSSEYDAILISLPFRRYGLIYKVAELVKTIR